MLLDGSNPSQRLAALSGLLQLHLQGPDPHDALFHASLDLLIQMQDLAPHSAFTWHSEKNVQLPGPRLQIFWQDRPFGVSFWGAPSGYEFSALLEAMEAAEHPESFSGLDPLSRALLEEVTQAVHIQLFVSPTCTRCPGLARLVIAGVAAQPLITADIITIDSFPDWGARYHVLGVPTAWIEPGPLRITGVVPPAYLAAQIVQASSSLA
ncbi:MAG: thioredoxin family protein, partial [Firmicutes bacterium]|nr:thioredoxin family protein [Bacillota bacterium]